MFAPFYYFPGCRSRKAYFFSLAALGLSLILAFWLTGLEATADQIRSQTLRLHILANSDSPQDQALKLQVRDAVLAQFGPELQRATDREDAAAFLERNLPEIEALAAETLERCGSKQTVRARLQTHRFSTTQYDGFALPAGEYLALRIELGEAKGHNWFCCLYPAFCLGAAEAHYETPAQNELVLGNHVVKFKVLEFLENRRIR